MLDEVVYWAVRQIWLPLRITSCAHVIFFHVYFNFLELYIFRIFFSEQLMAFCFCFLIFNAYFRCREMDRPAWCCLHCLKCKVFAYWVNEHQEFLTVSRVFKIPDCSSQWRPYEILLFWNVWKKKLYKYFRYRVDLIYVEFFYRTKDTAHRIPC